MTKEKMCLWVNQQTCKFSGFSNITDEAMFYDEYCDLCLKGKLINEVSNMNKKLDKIIISMKK